MKWVLLVIYLNGAQFSTTYDNQIECLQARNSFVMDINVRTAECFRGGD